MVAERLMRRGSNKQKASIMEKGRKAATAALQRAIRKHVRGVREGGAKRADGADKIPLPPHSGEVKTCSIASGDDDIYLSGAP